MCPTSAICPDHTIDYICEHCGLSNSGSDNADSRAYEQRAVSAGVGCKPPRGLQIAAQELQRRASTSLSVIVNSSLKAPDQTLGGSRTRGRWK